MKRKLVFYSWGFGVEKISKESIKKNLLSFKAIAKQYLKNKKKIEKNKEMVKE